MLEIENVKLEKFLVEDRKENGSFDGFVFEGISDMDVLVFLFLEISCLDLLEENLL